MGALRLPRKLYFSSATLSRRVVISYIIDYVIIVVLLIAFYALDAVEPFHQHFSLRNYTIQYPFAEHERVPISLLFTLNSLLPVIVIALYTLLIDGVFSHQPKPSAPRDGKRLHGGYRMKDRLWELNCGILGLLLAQGAAFVITGALKNATGKPRPDLIDRCRPRSGSADPPVFGLSNSTICTQANHARLKDGFRSFPSGHSSSAFAGLFYLSLYLSGKLHVLDNRGEVWKAFVVLVPTLGAALIAVSRIMDARHHPFDVISGSILGVAIAWCAYRQYFPSLSESWRKGRAFPIRTWATTPQRPDPEVRQLVVDPNGALVPKFGDLNDDQSHDDRLQVPDEFRGNAFRQQVSRSQRLRQPQIPDFSNFSSSSSLDFEASRTQLRPPPRVMQSQTRRLHSDDYWSASSDHETLDDIELQPQHSKVQGENSDSHGSSSDDRQKPLAKDTSYIPRNLGADPSAASTHNAGLAPSLIRTPAPDSRDGQSPPKARGVQLTETYK